MQAGKVGRRSALAAVIVAAVAWAAPASSEGAVTVRNGHYVGTGKQVDAEQNSLMFDFYVTGHETLESGWNHFNYGAGCGMDGAIGGAGTIQPSGKFTWTGGFGNNYTGRFRTRTKARGKLTFEQTNVMACPGTYEFRFTVRRVG